ncbi:MAG: pyridoxamine 5'-phosphate oxidase family protein [Labedaea sp.]
MTEREPVEVTNLDRYGNAALPWSRPSEQFAGATGPDLAYFLSTCGHDGRPHSTGIGALWDDGDLYFVSGPGTRKSRNLAANPACAVSVRLRGIDLVLEGEAVRVTEPATLERLAARYRDGGWPAEVSGAAFTAPFNAPSAGPPPWQLYRLVQRTAFGVATEEPHGATRWRF